MKERGLTIAEIAEAIGKHRDWVRYLLERHRRWVLVAGDAGPPREGVKTKRAGVRRASGKVAMEPPDSEVGDR